MSRSAHLRQCSRLPLGLVLGGVLLVLQPGLAFAWQDETQPQPTPPPSDAGAEEEAEDENDTQGPPLPPGLKIPPSPPELASLKKPLLPPGADNTFKREVQSDYTSARRNGVLTDSTKAVLSKAIEYRVLTLADPDRIQNLSDPRDRLLRELRDAARLQSQPRKAEQFRAFVMGEVVKNAEKLFDNNLYVRINAAVLLGQLNLTEEGRNTPAKPFLPATDALAKLIADPDQPEAVKVAATRSTLRMLKEPDLDANMRLKATEAIAKELLRTDTHYWYQMRLANALGYARLIFDRSPSPKPFVIDALTQTLVDKNRHWLVRSKSAWALGRVPVNSQINTQLIIHEVMRLTEAMTLAQRQQPNEFFWPACFTDIYLAFKPLNPNEANSLQAGFLTKVDKNEIGGTAASAIQTAADPVTRATAAVLKNPKTPLGDNRLEAIQAWVKANPRQNDRIAPSLPALDVSSVDPAPARQ